jgi:hypothetical protein
MPFQRSKEIVHLFERELIVYKRVLQDERTPTFREVFSTLAFLTACQTPQASNQKDRPARTGQSSSPSSQYEVEPISGIQRPFGAPGTFQPGSGRGP